MALSTCNLEYKGEAARIINSDYIFCIFNAEGKLRCIKMSTFINSTGAL